MKRPISLLLLFTTVYCFGQSLNDMQLLANQQANQIIDLAAGYAHSYNSGSNNSIPAIGTGDGQLIQLGATYTPVADTSSGLGDYVVEVNATQTGSTKGVKLYFDLPNGTYNYKVTMKGSDCRFWIYDGSAVVNDWTDTSDTWTENEGSFDAVDGSNQQFYIGYAWAALNEKLRFKFQLWTD